MATTHDSSPNFSPLEAAAPLSGEIGVPTSVNTDEREPSPEHARERSVRRSRSARNFLSALTFWVWTTSFSWLFDETLLVAVDPPVSWASFAHGALAGLFLAFGVGACVGVVFGAFWAVTLRTRTTLEVLRAARDRVLGWLKEPNPQRQTQRITKLYVALSLLSAFCAASFFSTRELVLLIARPENLAALVLVCHLAFLLGVLVCRPFITLIVQAPISWLSRVKRLGWFWTRLWWQVLVLAILGAALLGAAIYENRQKLPYLPWHEFASLAVGMLMASLTAFIAAMLRPRASAALRWVARGVGATCFSIAAVSAFTLPAGSKAAHDAMAGKVLVGRVGLSPLHWLLDWDRDGQLFGFGGGDCQPLEASVHSGAVDVPDNGVDENCDGEDLSGRSLANLMGRWDYPVPDSWPERPDIVLVTIDTFSTELLASYGGKELFTPNLNAFSETAVLFEHYFSQGPSTRLSFPALFTSRYDTQIQRVIRGRHPFALASENLTLAEILKREGYATVAILPDSYFLPSRWRGLTQGFKVIDTKAIRARKPSQPHTAKQVTTQALKHLKKAGKKPLFLWVHYFDAHSPHRAPAGMSLRGNTRPERYAAEVSLVDREFGRLLRGIHKRLPNALVVVTGDHAIAFDEPRHAKYNYGQDLSTVVLHVPLLVSAPYLAPRRITDIASSIDLAPTIVNMLRLKDSLPFAGHSLVRALSGEGVARPPLVFSQFFLGEDKLAKRDPLRLVSARSPHYHVVLDRRTGIVQAWNWRKDREERDDLWPRELEPRVRAELLGLKQTLELFVYQNYARTTRASVGH